MDASIQSQGCVQASAILGFWIAAIPAAMTFLYTRTYYNALIALFGCAPSRPAIGPKPIAPNPVTHLSRPSGIILVAANPEVKHAKKTEQILYI